jgi:hypothetical protein
VVTGDRPIPRAWTGWRVEDVELPNGVRVSARLCPFAYYPITRPLGWVEHDRLHEDSAACNWPQSEVYILDQSSWPDLMTCGRCGAHVLDDKPTGYQSFLDRARLELHSSRKENQS